MRPDATSQTTSGVGQHPGRTWSVKYLVGLYGNRHGHRSHAPKVPRSPTVLMLEHGRLLLRIAFSGSVQVYATSSSKV